MLKFSLHSAQGNSLVKTGSYLGERETNNDPSQLYTDHKLNIKHDVRYQLLNTKILELHSRIRSELTEIAGYIDTWKQ